MKFTFQITCQSIVFFIFLTTGIIPVFATANNIPPLLKLNNLEYTVGAKELSKLLESNSPDYQPRMQPFIFSTYFINIQYKDQKNANKIACATAISINNTTLITAGDPVGEAFSNKNQIINITVFNYLAHVIQIMHNKQEINNMIDQIKALVNVNSVYKIVFKTAQFTNYIASSQIFNEQSAKQFIKFHLHRPVYAIGRSYIKNTKSLFPDPHYIMKCNENDGFGFATNEYNDLFSEYIFDTNEHDKKNIIMSMTEADYGGPWVGCDPYSCQLIGITLPLDKKHTTALLGENITFDHNWVTLPIIPLLNESKSKHRIDNFSYNYVYKIP